MQCERCGQAHDRCTGHSRQGRPCGNWPIRGLDKCRMHSGKRGAEAKADGERALQHRQAEQAVATYGLPRDVDPHTALAEEVARTAGHVAWLGAKIRELEDDELVWGTTEQTDKGATEFPGTDTTSEAKPSVWVKLYQDERAHLTRVAKAAVDAGVEERRVQLAEQQGELIAKVIRGVLDDLGVGDREDVPRVVRRHLTAVAS